MKSRLAGVVGVGLASAAAVLALTSAPAQAAPKPSDRTVTLHFECDNGQTFDAITAPADEHQLWAAGFVVGTHQVVVPLAYVPYVGKSGPLPADALICGTSLDGVAFADTALVLRGTP